MKAVVISPIAPSMLSPKSAADDDDPPLVAWLYQFDVLALKLLHAFAAEYELVLEPELELELELDLGFTVSILVLHVYLNPSVVLRVV
jgi:hypothetical protein